MTTTTIDDSTTTRTRRTASPLPAIAGVWRHWPPPPARPSSSATPWPARTPRPTRPTALAGSSAQPAALLVGIYALLALAVAGSLAARLGRGQDTGAIRLIPVLAAVHLLLMTLFLAAPGRRRHGRHAWCSRAG